MKPLTPHKQAAPAGQPARPRAGSSKSGALQQSDALAKATSSSQRTPSKAGATDRPTPTYSQLPESSSACCPQCHTIQSSFYCGTCLSERIISHHANTRRVREAQQKAKVEVEQRLGIPSGSTSSEYQQKASSPDASGVPDPFVDAGDAAPICDLDNRRRILAQKAALEDSIKATRQRVEAIRQAREAGVRLAKQSRHSIDRRAAALQSAKSIALGERYESEASAAAQASTVSRASNENTKVDIARLEAACQETCKLLAQARAKRAREVAELFSIVAPSGTLASARSAKGTSAAQTGSLQPTAARSKRSRERYMPGGLSFDFSGAFDVGSKGQSKHSTDATSIQNDDVQHGNIASTAEAAVNLNDWSINGLVLPLTGDLRRFPRSTINGALEHLVILLQLVTGYLGITLPFVISTTAGVLTIRPNVLWGSGAKETLHLPSNVYQAAAVKGARAQRASGLSDMGASMMSTLGASTMSTFESFVRLPGAGQLPWAKMQEDDQAKSEKEVRTTSRIDDATSKASKQYGNAFSMLIYDVAYLAHIQGVPIDLVAAAGSPLRLLSKALSSQNLGCASHTTHYRERNVGNLVFANLDFTQLSQIHEPGGSTHGLTLKKDTESSRKGAKPSSKVRRDGETESRAEQVLADLDGSYIDAKLAAASILDVRQSAKPDGKKPLGDTTRQDHTIPKDARPRQPSSAVPPVVTEKKEPVSALSKVASQDSSASRAKAMQSSLAMERMPGALPVNQPGTLDFLRSRGERAALPSRLRNTTEEEQRTGRSQASHDSAAQRVSASAGQSKQAQGKAAPSRKSETPREKEKKRTDGDSGRAKDSLKPPTRSADAAKTTESAAASDGKARATIMFNGKPVQGTILRDKGGRAATSTSSTSKRSHRDDDEWDVL